MFVYQGKLKWQNLADDETLTIIFSKGAVRAEDPVYLFSQWTRGEHGAEKENWFQTIIVKDLRKIADTDEVTFTLAGAQHTFVITTEDHHKKISVDISDPNTGAKANTVLERRWKAKGKTADDASLRIWTGKITWRENAVNEQALFMLPEGYGDKRPVIASWQWTKDGSGNLKKPVFIRDAHMKALPSDGGFAKFSFDTNFFDITCNWDMSTEQLAVKLKGEGQEVDIGKLNLKAKVEVHTHTFDTVDPAPPSKKELEVRLPQPQSSLLRILDPLPFPRTLHETLAQTYAFVDQAGHLAIQAQNRFAALDTDYHKQLLLVEAAKKEKKNLESRVKSLGHSLDDAKAKIKELEHQLEKAIKDAEKMEADLRKTIKGLQNHDIKDEALIKKLQDDLITAKAKSTSLEIELNALKVERQALFARIKAMHAEISELKGKKLELENTVKVQNKRNEALQKKVCEVTKERDDLAKANRDLQDELARAKKDIEIKNKKLLEKDDKISKAEKELSDAKAQHEITTTTLTQKFQNRNDDFLASEERLLKVQLELSNKVHQFKMIANQYEDMIDEKRTNYKELAEAVRAL